MSINIERKIFERMRPDTARLAESGFVLHGRIWRLNAEIADGELEAELMIILPDAANPSSEKISADQGEHPMIIAGDNSVRCGRYTVAGRVYDPFTTEEYAPLRVEGPVGTFAATVREEYTGLLEQIAAATFMPVPFISDQANRIADALLDRYGDSPEFPFDDDGETGIWRLGSNNKWYCILMHVRSRNLKSISSDQGAEKIETFNSDGTLTDDYLTILRRGRPDPDRDPEKLTEILNVKVDQRDLPALLEEDGIYICYHMNKKMWVTMVLDDTLPDDRILTLIDRSRSLVSAGQSGKSSGGAAEAARRHSEGKSASWLIPSRPAHYDVDAGFRDSPDGTIGWHQNIKAKEGDTVYIYQSEPVASVRFKCEVVKANISHESYWEKGEDGEDWDELPEKYKKWMEKPVMILRLIETYEQGLFPRSFINEHGVAKTVRGQRSCPDELIQAMEAVLENR